MNITAFPYLFITTSFLIVLISIACLALAPALQSIYGQLAERLNVQKLSAQHDASAPVVDGTRLDSMMYFVHLTDLHLSHQNSARTHRFEAFLDQILPVLRPRAVVLSGDIVHAHTNGRSGQVKSEWQTYRSTLERRNLFDPDIWLDVRGNHDVRNVWSSPLSDDAPAAAIGMFPISIDPFQNYSVSGVHRRPGSYVASFSDDRGALHQFAIVDQNPKPGAHRFFSFFGVSPSDTSHLQLSNSTNGSLILVGHYPSFMVDNFPSLLHNTTIRSAYLRGWSKLKLAMSKVAGIPLTLTATRALPRAPLAYLCGHLHDGLLDFLHTRHRQGTLELEGVDFKERSSFRVLAIDNGLLSFVDVAAKRATSHQTTVESPWPVVLITNPKASAYLSPIEPWHRIQFSTHIRILIFAPPGSVLSVNVKIFNHSGDEFESVAVRGHCDPAWWRTARANWLEASAENCPLFVAPWRPSDLAPGLHTIQVVAAFQDDNSVRNVTSHQEFSVDGTLAAMPLSKDPTNKQSILASALRVFISLVARALLHTEFAVSLPLCVLVAWMAVVVPFLLAPLVWLRMFNRFENDPKISTIHVSFCARIALNMEHVIRWLFQLLVETARTNLRGWWLLFLWSMYLPFGPILWATLVDHKPALLFSWGAVFLDGSGVSLLMHQDVLFYLFSRLMTGFAPTILFMCLCSAIQQSGISIKIRTAVCVLMSVWFLMTLRDCVNDLEYWVAMFSWRSIAFSPAGAWFSALSLWLMGTCLVSLWRFGKYD